ncbi:MAG TPA: ATP-binding protein [Bacteroidales bacterium]|nr:ATP-binding protein [Bacteroidales bacterium]HOK98492.1 ATP-binding protein [Bacteroidales bacterium]HPO64418.1 ATP-binding protein [Bacteroidales bacterium]
MKFHKPINLLILGSLIVAVSGTALFLLLSQYHSSIITTISVFVLIAIISFIVFKQILEKFIYEKIKVIYKTIHTLKLPKKEKNKRVNLNEDVLEKVSWDVSMWAQKHQQEIEDLRKMEAYRREFLGNVSHELKTPLFNLQGFVLTLLEGAIDDPEVNRAYLEKAAKNLERMINLVRDLEIIAQLESGEIKMNYSRFDIISLTREVFEMLELKAKQKNIQLIFNEKHDDGLPIWVMADRERIRQVLHNLIENAINYGNENGRTKVSFYEMNDLILVEVSDNGIGIEEKHIPRLFERFYRVDKSRSRNLGGSGLGLAIVKHIIESHGQAIHVRSAPGVGSTFSFTLQRYSN